MSLWAFSDITDWKAPTHRYLIGSAGIVPHCLSELWRIIDPDRSWRTVFVKHRSATKAISRFFEWEFFRYYRRVWNFISEEEKFETFRNYIPIYMYSVPPTYFGGNLRRYVFPACLGSEFYSETVSRMPTDISIQIRDLLTTRRRKRGKMKATFLVKRVSRTRRPRTT